jgi:hypothetical protein
MALYFVEKNCVLKWLRQNEWLISVPTGSFVAAALLSLQKTFVADASLSTEQSFLGASDEPLGPTDVFCAKAQC